MAVEFNDENQLRAAQMYAQLQQGGVSQGSKWEQMLVNKGIVQTTTQARMVLILIIIAAFASSGFIMFKTFSTPKVKVSPEEQRLIDYNNNLRP